MQPSEHVLYDWEDDYIGSLWLPTYSRTKTFARSRFVRPLEFVTRTNFYPEPMASDCFLILYEIKPNCTPCFVKTVNKTYFLGEVEKSENGNEVVYLLNPHCNTNFSLSDTVTIERYFDQFVFKVIDEGKDDPECIFACYKLNDSYGLLGFYALFDNAIMWEKDDNEYSSYDPTNPKHLYVPSPDEELQQQQQQLTGGKKDRFGQISKGRHDEFYRKHELGSRKESMDIALYNMNFDPRNRKYSKSRYRTAFYLFSY